MNRLPVYGNNHAISEPFLCLSYRIVGKDQHVQSRELTVIGRYESGLRCSAGLPSAVSLRGSRHAFFDAAVQDCRGFQFRGCVVACAIVTQPH